MDFPIRACHGLIVSLVMMAATTLGCATGQNIQDDLSEPSDPYVLVLGTAQDGGFPQTGCRSDCCMQVREDPTQERLVSSILLVDPRTGGRWLFDAGPDFKRQVERAEAHQGQASTGQGRPPLFDGIFLTHAHMGHYTGLMHLGREAYGSDPQVVYATPSMGDYLKNNGPWSLLVEDEAIALEPLTPGAPIRLSQDLEVVPLLVPHRDEFSDTVGFVIRGPNRSLLFLPDIDKWERWERPIEDVLEDVSLAMVDGTFFGPGELQGRDMSVIPHPFIVETLERLGRSDAQTRAKLIFTHLNHSNPASDPLGEAALRIRAFGAAVAREGDVHEL